MSDQDQHASDANPVQRALALPPHIASILDIVLTPDEFKAGVYDVLDSEEETVSDIDSKLRTHGSESDEASDDDDILLADL